MQETWAQTVGQEDPLEKEIATHSSILAWELLKTEEPSRLQAMGSQKSQTQLSNETTVSSPVRRGPQGIFSTASQEVLLDQKAIACTY